MTSVKANIGHTETVSGIAGIIKVVLMMQHGLIPAQLHLQTLNPHLGLEGSRLRIPTEPVAWQAAGEQRGLRASAPSASAAPTRTSCSKRRRRRHPRPQPRPTGRCTCWPCRPRRESGVGRDLPDATPNYLEQQSDGGRCRRLLLRQHRPLAFQPPGGGHGRDAAELRERLQALRDGSKSPGVKAGRVKLASCAEGRLPLHRPRLAVRRHGARRCSRRSRRFARRFSSATRFSAICWSSRCCEVLYPARRPELRCWTRRPTRSRRCSPWSMRWPSCGESWGVEPAALLGHSVGEYVAACVAGVFSLEDGLRLIATRSTLMQQLPHDGLMAVVFAPSERVRARVGAAARSVSVAAANGPENTVISGAGGGGSRHWSSNLPRPASAPNC